MTWAGLLLHQIRNSIVGGQLTIDLIMSSKRLVNCVAVLLSFTLHYLAFLLSSFSGNIL